MLRVLLRAFDFPPPKFPVILRQSATNILEYYSNNLLLPIKKLKFFFDLEKTFLTISHRFMNKVQMQDVSGNT